MFGQSIYVYFVTFSMSKKLFCVVHLFMHFPFNPDKACIHRLQPHDAVHEFSLALPTSLFCFISCLISIHLAILLDIQCVTLTN